MRLRRKPHYYADTVPRETVLAYATKDDIVDETVEEILPTKENSWESIDYGTRHPDWRGKLKNKRV